MNILNQENDTILNTLCKLYVTSLAAKLCSLKLKHWRNRPTGRFQRVFAFKPTPISGNRNGHVTC